MTEPTDLYYPEGCPICGNRVTLEKDIHKYICYSCHAHADCHKETTELYRKYEPTETMASNETHVLRAEVRSNFSKLFRERRYVQGGHEMIQTSIINIIYPIHLVKTLEEDGEMFYKVIKRHGESFTVMSMDNGEIMQIDLDNVQPASNRDKAMVYLGEKTGSDWVKVNIGFFDEKELKKVNTIIHSAIQEGRKKSLETY